MFVVGFPNVDMFHTRHFSTLHFKTCKESLTISSEVFFQEFGCFKELKRNIVEVVC
jgi:hypothetical protein